MNKIDQSLPKSALPMADSSAVLLNSIKPYPSYSKHKFFSSNLWEFKAPLQISKPKIRLLFSSFVLLMSVLDSMRAFSPSRLVFGVGSGRVLALSPFRRTYYAAMDPFLSHKWILFLCFNEVSSDFPVGYPKVCFPLNTNSPIQQDLRQDDFVAKCTRAFISGM